jgi:hypothetical protein
MSTCRKLFVEVDGARVIGVFGRTAWALDALISAGEHGVTPISHPAPRWAAYIFKLRQAGVDVETINEEHFGPFPGHHARYVLRSVVRIVTPPTPSTVLPHACPAGTVADG